MVVVHVVNGASENESDEEHVIGDNRCILENRNNKRTSRKGDIDNDRSSVSSQTASTGCNVDNSGEETSYKAQGEVNERLELIVNGTSERFNNLESEDLLKEDRNHESNQNMKKMTLEAETPVLQEIHRDKKLPIDRGWAWVILLASVYAHFIIIGQLKCFGIVFVQLQQRYGSSSSETTLIFTLMNAIYSITALIVMTVGSALSARTSVCIGAAIASVSSMVTAFIDDVNLAILTIGIATGLSNAFVMPQISTIISVYFVKRRGFANNMANSGVSLGAIVLAPIVTKSFEYYAYTGTYIVFTGLNLQLFVIACLLTPMTFYKDISLGRSSASKEFDIREEEQDTLIHVLNKDTTNATGHFHRQLSHNETLNNSKMQVTARRRRVVSESEHVSSFRKQLNEQSTSTHSLFNSPIARFASTDVMNNSMLDITLTKRESYDHYNHQIKPRTCWQAIKTTIVRSLLKIFDMKLLSKPVFQYFLICNAFLCTGCGLASAFLPPLAIEHGISNDLVALMVSLMSVIEFSSRFVLGYLSDKNWCHRSTLIAISTVILGLVAHFLHLMTTFSTIMIYAVVAGLLQGVYFSLYVVVILDILTDDDFKGALGFISLVQGISSGIGLPIVGYIRDTSGNYAYTFNFIGALLMAGGVMIYFIPNIDEWSKNRSKKPTEEKQMGHVA